jgi:hypothetical protein
MVYRRPLDQRFGANDRRSGKEVWVTDCPTCRAVAGEPCFLDKPKPGRGWGGYERYINHKERSLLFRSNSSSSD